VSTTIERSCSTKIDCRIERRREDASDLRAGRKLQNADGPVFFARCRISCKGVLIRHKKETQLRRNGNEVCMGK
jgi:hypothetical protein